MQAILKKYPTLQHHKRAVAAGAVAAGIILAVGIILSFVYLYLKTTLVRMKSEVIRAIQDEDAVALWRMADPMERQRLNLTPGNAIPF
ncbi:MAG TPA: hypothetical protein VKV18_09790 [Chthonomonas sp.]|uniref:hypothetical protein n=1 Tax=Chthonomonas sp. TaxID=2282153 RepID=UPI002B4AB1E9|nr:hypothetical protein [Chthonomonas sp.]HLI48966.1 hypothetical protein [Chthonomonas sp.]